MSKDNQVSSGFDGAFDLLPFRSHLDCGQVPLYPTSDDFQLASMGTVHEEQGSWAEAAKVWHFEAVRERRLRHACAFDAPTLKAIALRVAAKLYERARAAS